jgi:superfamily II DNA helicase RecQ
LIQEIGRAGRDGTHSKSIIFYSRNDIRTLFLIITQKEKRYEFYLSIFILLSIKINITSVHYKKMI